MFERHVELQAQVSILLDFAMICHRYSCRTAMCRCVHNASDFEKHFLKRFVSAGL